MICDAKFSLTILVLGSVILSILNSICKFEMYKYNFSHIFMHYHMIIND